MKEIISQKKWVYTLYKTDNGLLLSVVCGGVAMFDVDVLLSDEDAIRAEADEEFLDSLVEDIRNSPKEYISSI